MKLKKHNIWGKHSAYLTENMLMLLVLLVIVSVTLSSFMKGQTLKQESKEQLMANVTAQNLVEYGKMTQMRYEDVLLDLGASKEGKKYYFYYDSAWQIMQEATKCSYLTEVNISGEQLASGEIKTIQVNVYRRQVDEVQIIYSLSAKVY